MEYVLDPGIEHTKAAEGCKEEAKADEEDGIGEWIDAEVHGKEFKEEDPVGVKTGTSQY